MKKTISLFLIVFVLLCLVACGKDCPSCSTGYVRCTSCDGDGERDCSNCFYGTNICINCKTVDCNKCDDSPRKGYITYDIVEESIYRASGRYNPEKWMVCWTCNGSGKLRTQCSYCESGKIKCTDCNGQGRFTCTKCNGSGSATCSTCKGKCKVY